MPTRFALLHSLFHYLRSNHTPTILKDKIFFGPKDHYKNTRETQTNKLKQIETQKQNEKLYIKKSNNALVFINSLTFIRRSITFGILF